MNCPGCGNATISMQHMRCFECSDGAEWEFRAERYEKALREIAEAFHCDCNNFRQLHAERCPVEIAKRALGEVAK